MLNNPIINKTGLACLLWAGKPRDILRRRLEVRFKRKTFTPTEIEQISLAVQKLQADFNIMKNEQKRK